MAEVLRYEPRLRKVTTHDVTLDPWFWVGVLGLIGLAALFTSGQIGVVRWNAGSER